MESEIAALRDRYHDVTPLDRVAEGSRYSAALADGSPVIVHVLRRELGARMRDSAAFLSHLERASSVRRDEITPPVSWGCDQGVFHCAYVRAELSEPTPGMYSAESVADIGVRLAEGLHAAHRAGFAHGAIATSRLRITDDHAPRLGSFGLASALIAGGVEARHAAAELSEAAYVCPEQQAGGPPTARGDVYALGATLYELLTGKAPFGGRTTAHLLATVLPEEPTSDGRQATPADAVIAALLRAIERAPEDRWPDALTFAAALAAPYRKSDERASAPRRQLGSRFAAIFRSALFPARRSRE